jgi:hypothetical protein
MEMIEYHNHTAFLEAIKNPKFEPCDGLRYNGFISKAVEFNNFTAFKNLINHSKLNPKDVIDKKFIYRIIKRVAFCDNADNRIYFDELMNSNFPIDSSYLREHSLDYHIFIELFNKIDKKDFMSLRNACNIHSKDIKIFQTIFQYMKQHFPEKMTKEFVDYNFLIPAFQSLQFAVIELIKEEGYDIKFIQNKSPFSYMISNFTTSGYKVYSKLITYLLNQDISYENDLLKDINMKSINGYYYHSYSYQLNAFLFIKDNYSDLKKLYPNIGTKKTNLLFNIFSVMLFSRIIDLTDYHETLLFAFENFSFINPMDSIDQIFLTNIKTKNFLSDNINLLKDFLLILIHYGYEIPDAKKNIIKNVSIFVIDENFYSKENAKNRIESLLKIIKPKKSEKKNKKNLIV